MEEIYENEKDFGDTNLEIMTSASVRGLPHRCVGVIYAWEGGKLILGTGFLLASNLVVTVAHNLYSRESKGYLKNLVFYPGVSGEHNQKNGLKIIDWRLPQEYISAEGLDPIKYDYALLKLKEPIEIKDSLYPVLVPDFTELEMVVTVCGYKEVTKEEYFQIMHSNALKYSQHGGRYDIDTYSGQSGGPVFFMEKLNGKEVACVVGVHKGYDKIANLNLCALITGEVVGNLEKWMAEMGLVYGVKNAGNKESFLAPSDDSGPKVSILSYRSSGIGK